MAVVQLETPKYSPEVGLLVLNLGTPEEPTPAAVRRYLREFLWDPRVVEAPRWLWWLILNGIILTTRPQRSAHAYQRIWQQEGSPLLLFSQKISQALHRQLWRQMPGQIQTVLAMRYGHPSIANALGQFKKSGVKHILMLPLYPQYSATTTASCFDAVTSNLHQWRKIPELRTIMSYYDEPSYIQALANSVHQHWQTHGRAQKLLFSFHSIPEKYTQLGDPYAQHCQETAHLVAQELDLSHDQWQMCFQSRLGSQTWLQPYTDTTLKQLPAHGIKSVEIICPGFAADCLETLEEIVMTDREIFLQAGGTHYRYIPALNDQPEHIHALSQLVMKHLQGWI